MNDREKWEIKFDRVLQYKRTVAHKNSLMKRYELQELHLYQKDINELVERGYHEKVRQG